MPWSPRKARVDCAVNREEALRYLGHTGQHIDESLMSRIESLAQECEKDAKATYVWRSFEINQQESAIGAFRLHGAQLELSGESMTDYLEGAVGVAILACTLGIMVDRKLAEYSSTKPLDAMIYGACANAMIETCAQAAQDDISEALASRKLFARMRFSPGYGDLDISVQPDVLRELDAFRQLGLSVGPNMMMTPTKSITAVCGIFQEKQDGKGSSPCRNCITRDFCSYREKGTTCHGRS